MNPPRSIESPWWTGDVATLADEQLRERSAALARTTLLALRACSPAQVEQAAIGERSVHYLELREPGGRQDLVDAFEAWLEAEEECERRDAFAQREHVDAAAAWSTEDLTIDLGEAI